MRIEKDIVGEKKIPKQALYGIHALRASENFPCTIKFSHDWYKAIGDVKLAVYETYKKFLTSANQKFKLSEFNIPIIKNSILDALIKSAEEVSEGKHFESFIVPAISGGAGTSINMNINEIIANTALLRLKHEAGEYNLISPFNEANIYQSTNDVIPSALKLALIKKLDLLELEINATRESLEKIESTTRETLRLGYTEMMAAVPSSYGKLFSAYAEALTRDWWRVSKCKERLKFINLGGSAIGTGLTVPKFMIFEMTNTLKEITKLPIARSENLEDATSNFDSFVEVHATLKANAVNLEKIASDLRLLASDLTSKEIELPQKQAGSSIMPGKVNPVISEFVISSCHKIYANDLLVSNLSGQGSLDLNAYTPIIGHTMLDTIELLINSLSTLNKNLLADLKIHSQKSLNTILYSPTITTALIPFIGYEAASTLAKEMLAHNLSIFEANDNLLLIDSTVISEVLTKENLLKLGFSLNDIQKVLGGK